MESFRLSHARAILEFIILPSDHAAGCIRFCDPRVCRTLIFAAGAAFDLRAARVGSCHAWTGLLVFAGLGVVQGRDGPGEDVTCARSVAGWSFEHRDENATAWFSVLQ